MSDDRWQQWSDEMAVTDEVLRAFDGASLENLTPLERRVVTALLHEDHLVSVEMMKVVGFRKWWMTPRPEPTHIELELWAEANEALADVLQEADEQAAEATAEAWDALDAYEDDVSVNE